MSEKNYILMRKKIDQLDEINQQIIAVNCLLKMTTTAIVNKQDKPENCADSMMTCGWLLDLIGQNLDNIYEDLCHTVFSLEKQTTAS